MMLFGQDEQVAAWVAKQTGDQFVMPYTAIGVLDKSGDLTGGFVFNTYTGPSIELSLAGNGVARRTVWAGILHYVFEQLGCKRLQIHTRRDNKRVTKIAPRMGFKFEGTARRYYGTTDGICYSLIATDLPAFRARWGI